MEEFKVIVPADIEAASKLRCELRRWLFHLDACSADTEKVIQRIQQEFLHAIAQPCRPHLLEVRLYRHPGGVNVELREAPGSSDPAAFVPSGRLIEQFMAHC